MHRFFLWGILLLWIALPEAFSAEPAPPEVKFDIGPPPPWVRPIPRDASPAPSSDHASELGVDILVIDEQEEVNSGASYEHQIRRIVSDRGVQDSSAVTVVFDPTYQHLTLHSIQVTRAGKSVNRLNRAAVRLYQRERDMESYLLDGRYTAQCQLEDVRVGDEIEFAYTITGANPVLGGRYTNTFDTSWAIPIHHFFLRLIYPAARPLHFKTFNRALHPRITTSGEKTEWINEETDIPQHRQDEGTPPGYTSYGSIQISEYQGWAQVRDWAAPLYHSVAPLTPALRQEIDALRALPDAGEQVQAALRFVQEEIRYLGLEQGTNSHQPTPPGEVLSRRFGDCKDKALLLATLLHALGIEAEPALVNTDRGKAIRDFLPSPNAFNHVILRVKVLTGAYPGTYWLDATRTHQRGPLGQLSVGDYGYALLVEAPIPSPKYERAVGGRKLNFGESVSFSADELTRYYPSLESLPRQHTIERYRVPAPGSVAHLRVTTECQGTMAEWMRTIFAQSSPENIKTSYLKFYARRYPGIQLEKPITYEETAEGIGTVTEEYAIPNLWTLDETKQNYTASFDAGGLRDRMGDPIPSQRSDPAGLDYPLDATNEIQLELFQPWPAHPQTLQEHNDFFRYTFTSTGQGTERKLRYRYETLTERIPIDELEHYNAALTRVKESLGITLTYRNPGASLASGNVAAAPEWTFNWPLAAVFFGCLAVSIAGALWLLLCSKRAMPRPPIEALAPWEGLGGWLIIVAIALCLRPFLYLLEAWRAGRLMLNLQAWQILTKPSSPNYNPWWQPSLIFEGCIGIAGLCLSLVVLILFFQRRALFPRWQIIMLCGAVLNVLIDGFLALQIPTLHHVASKAIGQTFGAFLGSFLWILYFCFSKRVRATFRF